jgi:hypothetical protein
MQLKVKKVGKKKYYHDPLKDAWRNMENPKDVQIPNSRLALSRMLFKVRDTIDWE